MTYATYYLPGSHTRMTIRSRLGGFWIDSADGDTSGPHDTLSDAKDELERLVWDLLVDGGGDDE